MEYRQVSAQASDAHDFRVIHFGLKLLFLTPLIVLGAAPVECSLSLGLAGLGARPSWPHPVRAGSPRSWGPLPKLSHDPVESPFLPCMRKL